MRLQGPPGSGKFDKKAISSSSASLRLEVVHLEPEPETSGRDSRLSQGKG